MRISFQFPRALKTQQIAPQHRRSSAFTAGQSRECDAAQRQSKASLPFVSALVRNPRHLISIDDGIVRTGGRELAMQNRGFTLSKPNRPVNRHPMDKTMSGSQHQECSWPSRRIFNCWANRLHFQGHTPIIFYFITDRADRLHQKWAFVPSFSQKMNPEDPLYRFLLPVYFVSVQDNITHEPLTC